MSKRSSSAALAPAAATASAWLLFILTLQGQQPALRMRLWRALKALGTAMLRDGVYLLPHRAEFVQALHDQSSEVVAAGGSAQILEFGAKDAAQETEFRLLFDRTDEYAKLLSEVRTTRKEMRGLDEAGLLARVARLRRDFDSIAVTDFFPDTARDQTQEALEDLLRAVNEAISPDEPHAAPGRIERLDPAQYQGRTWATRQRPWADRLASAWLIKRHIDPRAKFVWLKNPRDCPKRALGFDFDGAQFSHIGSRVSFEVLLASFALEHDSALERIGAVIHHLDVGGVPVPEAAGLAALFRGAAAALPDDDELLDEACKLLDYLYGYYAAMP
jgi:hypothetical protein